MNTQVLKKVQSKDGTTIAYEQLGAGPVVILVGAALSTRAESAQMAALLADHFTVINYDRRGRGDSDNAAQQEFSAQGFNAASALQHEIDDIEALVDAAGGTAFAFGSSSGAALALQAANRLPGKLQKLVLFEPPYIVEDSRPRVPADFTTRVNALVSSGRRGEAVEFFMTQAVGVPVEFMAGMQASPMWPALEQQAHTLPYDGAVMGDTQAGLPLPANFCAAVKAPVLVLDGGESPPWLHNAAQALAAVLPNAQYRSLPGLDHSSASMAPDALAPVLIEFFAGRR